MKNWKEANSIREITSFYEINFCGAHYEEVKAFTERIGFSYSMEEMDGETYCPFYIHCEDELMWEGEINPYTNEIDYFTFYGEDGEMYGSAFSGLKFE